MAGRKRDPDDSSGDEAMKAANARAAKEIEDAERAERESGSREREVSIEEDDDDEEAAEAPTGRKERRNGRSAHQQAREEAERRAEAAEQRARQLETHNLALAAIVGTPRGEARPAEPSPVDQELERAFEDAERLNDEWDSLPRERQLDPDTLKGYRKRMRAIDIRKTELALKKQQGPSQPTMSKEQLIAEATLENDFADVNGHPAGRKLIAHEFEALRVLGSPDSLATLRVAAEAARKRLGLSNGHQRSSRVPDESLKAKLSGGTFRSHGGGGDPRPTTIRMTKEDRIMAHATYPSLSPADAEKRWAQKIGGKMVRAGERD